MRPLPSVHAVSRRAPQGRPQCKRFTSARHATRCRQVAYDGNEIEQHPLMAPGEVSIKLRMSTTKASPGCRYERYVFARSSRRRLPARCCRGRSIATGSRAA
jgi:hypothetical protein